MSKYQVNNQGFYGKFGGAFIPEMLYPNVEELRNNYLQIMESEEFKKEFDSLMVNYVGRPHQIVGKIWPQYLSKT